MIALEPIVQAIEYTEAHLRAPVSVADMASVAAYSLYHFCRMFGKLTRHTPYDYLIRRRMTLAAGEIIRTDRRIIDIALDFQFDSHEGFTRAFQRMFGTCPANARRQQAVPAAFCLPRLTASHLICLQRQQGLIPKMTERPSTDGSALTTRIPGPGEVMPIAVAQDWPASGTSPSNCESLPGGRYGCFTLTQWRDDLSLVLDWALHVWLFYAPYALRLPYVLIQGEDGNSAQLCVPVQPRG